MDTALANAMIDYYKGDKKRIQHFLKVCAFCELIGSGEKLDDKTMRLISAAALTHDIGIKNSELKYGSSAGKYQQIEGPAVAEEMLSSLGYDSGTINRICYMIAHHHTYTNIDGVDLQILIEADLIVNFCEENGAAEAVSAARDKIFKTKSGISLLKSVFMI